MPESYQQERYARSTITDFVTGQSHLEQTPESIQNIQSSEVFKDVSGRPDGPVDLIYRFSDAEHKPALGFQQVDGDQDEEEFYSLVYIDPSLSSAWNAVVGQTS